MKAETATALILVTGELGAKRAAIAVVKAVLAGYAVRYLSPASICESWRGIPSKQCVAPRF